mgnify:CR=1 FL=1
MSQLDNLYRQLSVYRNFLDNINISVSKLGRAIESAYDVENLKLYFSIDEESVDSNILFKGRDLMIDYYNQIYEFVIPSIETEINRLKREIERASSENMY